MLAAALSALLALASTGCLFVDEEAIDEGIVRSETADVFSSTALVALKVATVHRGQEVDILRRTTVTGTTHTEDWLQVRLGDDERTTGWIEARHIVSRSVVDRSKEIAGSPDSAPALARGRLKVNQRLRLKAGRDGDVATLLARGTEFDIVGKETTIHTSERKKGDDEEEAQSEEFESKTDVWYRVRLASDSIVHGGYLLANSVSLEVPDEIAHLEGDGRRFVGWISVGSVIDPKLAVQAPDRAERFHYISFMRRATAEDEVDFERVYCLFWHTDSHSYYGPYVEDLRGVFPVSQREEGGRKLVTIHVLDANDKHVPVEYEVFRTEKGKLDVKRLTPPVPGERARSHR
jgi:hypothetical protein